ncbi:MAG: serine/threonine protein kinase [bacterium]|nr:serine/threonine protein kinase [bacterium]
MNGTLNPTENPNNPVEPIGRLGGYELIQVLSRSVVTTVYKAWQPTLNRYVLIKQLHPQLAQETDIFNRFTREGKALARVRHENLVQVFDMSDDRQNPFLVMEWVEGQNLHQLLKRGGSIPVPVACVILLEILKGLDAAHYHGIIHRDIKPENVLISRDGRIKITDFGLAIYEQAPAITRPGTVIGTPSFMAPETITGGQVDKRTDFFALGATFYELVTNTRVFTGNTFSEVLHLVLSKQPDKPSSIVRTIPPEVDKLILKMLEKDPRKRPQTGEEIVKSIHKIMDVYHWSTDPTIISHYISDPSGFRIELTRRKPIRRTRTILSYVLVLIFLVMVGFILHHQFTTITRLRQIDTLTTQHVQTLDTLAIQDTDTKDVEKGIEQTTWKPMLQKDTVTPSITNITKPGIGYLKVNCEPWAYLRYGDPRKEVLLPIASTLEIPSGNQTLEFYHPEFPIIRKMVNVPKNDTARIFINLWDEVSLVRIGLVEPWADVFINQKNVGVTPFSKPIPVQPGPIEIKLVHPTFGMKTFQFNLMKGQSTPTIQWNFEKNHAE